MANAHLNQFDMKGRLVKKYSNVITEASFVPLGIVTDGDALVVTMGDAYTNSTTYWLNKKGKQIKSTSSFIGNRGVGTNRKDLQYAINNFAIDGFTDYDKKNNLSYYALFTNPHYCVTHDGKILLSTIPVSATYDEVVFIGFAFYLVKTVTNTGAVNLSGIETFHERLGFISNIIALEYYDRRGHQIKSTNLPFVFETGERYVDLCQDGKNVWIIEYDVAGGA